MGKHYFLFWCRLWRFKKQVKRVRDFYGHVKKIFLACEKEFFHSYDREGMAQEMLAGVLVLIE